MQLKVAILASDRANQILINVFNIMWEFFLVYLLSFKVSTYKFQASPSRDQTPFVPHEKLLCSKP